MFEGKCGGLVAAFCVNPLALGGQDTCGWEHEWSVDGDERDDLLEEQGDEEEWHDSGDGT